MERIDYYKNNFKGDGILDFPIEEPSLFSEYFTVALSRFLQREKVSKGLLYNEKEAKVTFLDNEIRSTNESLIGIKMLLRNSEEDNSKFSLEISVAMQLEITNYGIYLNYLYKLQQIKPVFNPEAFDIVFSHLKPYFEVSEHTKLRQLIETGITNEKLLFLDNSVKLCDYFKKTFESKVLKGCNKKELNSWIVSSFQYRKGGIRHDFNSRTVENALSSRESLCKDPIV